VSAITDRIASDVSGIFARASDFGTEATFTFGTTSNVINVVFEASYKSANIYNNEIVNLGPVAFCSISDVTNSSGKVPGEDDTTTSTLEIDGTVYNITSCERESSDVGILRLTKDSV
jgi:hypothetical protein